MDINYSWGGIGQIVPDGMLHGVSVKRYNPATGKVNGGTKMQGLFGPDFAPAEYGGMRITVDKNIMQNVAQEWNKYNKLTSGQQFEYMRNLLVRSGDGLTPYIPVVVSANH